MKTYLILTVACLLVFGYVFMLESAEETPKEKWLKAEVALGSAVAQMETLNGNLQKKRAEYTEKGNNALQAAVTMFNPIDAIKTLFLGRGTPNRLWQLKQEITSIYIQMESLNGDLGMLASARDTAYEAYKKTESQPDPQKFQPNYADIPNFSLSCLNGCGTVYQSKSVGLGNLSDKAIMGHGVYCTSDPHKSYWYYSCPPNYPGCPASDKHYVACVGGCGQTGSPEWGYIGNPTGKGYGPSKSWGYNELVTIYSHLSRCSERVSGNSRCGGYYYTCNNQTSADCPNADNHVSGSTPPTGSTPPSGSNPPTDETPDCSDCTSHCGSPCSCSNSGTCDGTVSSPPSGSDPPSEGCSGNCWYGAGCAVTCVHCDAPYNICTSQWGDCSSSSDGYHSSG